MARSGRGARFERRPADEEDHRHDPDGQAGRKAQRDPLAHEPDGDRRREQRRGGVEQRRETSRQGDRRDRDEGERHGREEGADDQEAGHPALGDPPASQGRRRREATAAPIASRISAAHAGPTSGEAMRMNRKAAPQTAPRNRSETRSMSETGSPDSRRRSGHGAQRVGPRRRVAHRPRSPRGTVIRRVTVARTDATRADGAPAAVATAGTRGKIVLLT